ncbi:RnaseH-domain-containing protein [Irpex rosettiformis]|uniref:RnaseH-domain-containing protein n=1 Tax=Irpex rosettiformis TaxID=378272 RepID=A0ACB8UKC4_9APHY|nr:RnaseH-domain-containing protein [Irpex rosettiformis]
MQPQRDSQYAIDGLTTHLNRWQDRGWIGIENAQLFRSAAYHLRKRSAITTFEWVKGHNGNLGNEGADELAAQGAQQAQSDNIDLTVPDQWNLTGAKLLGITQAIAYTGIKQHQTYNSRPATLEYLDKTYHCVNDHLRHQYPTNSHMWQALRHKDITRKISDFLWKVMHGAMRVGKYWSHIPGYEHRGICPTCGVEDSMDHILVECTATDCTRIWELCHQIWLKKTNQVPWPPKHIGNILGAPLADFCDNEQVRQTGLSRLYRIMMTESAHLIWRLRCERRIDSPDDGNFTHTIGEVDRRWMAVMNTRLRLDCEMTRQKYGKKALSEQIVQTTWCGLLENEHRLPPNWATSGFLVGMGPLT